ncbi:P-loop containing nucleoside triphosphate hydrolase protein, partial [Pavlovales sp. CCMP2436]
FLELGLHDWLARSCAQLGMREPMPIQRACVPAILAGRDVIGRAATGSGKTAAFALPILQRLSEEPFGVFALIITPTRELAVQISEQCRALGERMHVRCEVVVGGADMIAQSAALNRRPHIVVGTPGRLVDHLRSGAAEAAATFGRLRVLVLDEADRLLDLGFGPEITQLLERLPPVEKRQTLLFSATITASLRELQ